MPTLGMMEWERRWKKVHPSKTCKTLSKVVIYPNVPKIDDLLFSMKSKLLIYFIVRTCLRQNAESKRVVYILDSDSPGLNPFQDICGQN